MKEREEKDVDPDEQQIIKLFTRAFKQTAYYGNHHRIALETIDQLFKEIHRSLKNKDELVFEITPSQVFLEKKTTAKEDMQAQVLAEGIYKKGISGIRFSQVLSRETLANFLGVITQDSVPPQGDLFWKLPGITLWLLILQSEAIEEENKEGEEEKLRALVHKVFSPLAPPGLSRTEELLEWAIEDQKHLVLALEQLLTETVTPEGLPNEGERAKTLQTFLTGIDKAYKTFLPTGQEPFLEKIALSITEIGSWEQVWFFPLGPSSPFKTLFHLIGPVHHSHVIGQIILSLFNKGSRLVSFLKQCEGEFEINQQIIPELKTQLEQVAQRHSISFTDLWFMVQGLFLNPNERQFMDDLYLKELEGFSEVMSELNWEEQSLSPDLKKAYERLFPLERAEITVPYLIEFLNFSKTIQEFIFMINELSGTVKELTLSGDFKNIAPILQEVSRAIATLPFHHDPSFPRVIAAWEELCQVDYSEMLLNFLPQVSHDDRPQLLALSPFLDENNLKSLLAHLEVIDHPNEAQALIDFLILVGEKIIPLLLELLKGSPMSPLILRGFQVIAHFQAQEAIPLIPDLLSRLSVPDKVNALRILSTLKASQMAPIVLPLLKQVGEASKTEIIQTFVQGNHGEILLILLRLLRSGSRLSRFPYLLLEQNLLEALGKVRYEPAVKLCQNILIEKYPIPLKALRRIREAAEYTLQEIGTSDALDVLKQERTSIFRFRKISSRDDGGEE